MTTGQFTGSATYMPDYPALLRLHGRRKGKHLCNITCNNWMPAEGALLYFAQRIVETFAMTTLLTTVAKYNTPINPLKEALKSARF